MYTVVTAFEGLRGHRIDTNVLVYAYLEDKDTPRLKHWLRTALQCRLIRPGASRVLITYGKAPPYNGDPCIYDSVEYTRHNTPA